MENKGPVPYSPPRESTFDKILRGMGMVKLIDKIIEGRRNREFKIALGQQMPVRKQKLLKLMRRLNKVPVKKLAPQAIPTRVLEGTLLATLVASIVSAIISPNNFAYNILVVPVVPMFFVISLGGLMQRLVKNRKRADAPKLGFAKEMAHDVFQEETQENLKLVFTTMLRHPRLEIQILGFEKLMEWGAPWVIPLLESKWHSWQESKMLETNDLYFWESHINIFKSRLEEADLISGNGFEKLAHHHGYWRRLNNASFETEQHGLLKYVDADLKEDDLEQFFVRRQRAGMWYPQVICGQCRVHAQEFDLNNSKTEVKCPDCYSNAHLIMPIREIIGYIGRPHINPPERSISYDVWEPESKTVHYFELDRLHIGHAENLNYEWAIAAIVEYYRNHLPPEHWPIKVSIEKGLELSRNSLNLLGHMKKGRKFST